MTSDSEVEVAPPVIEEMGGASTGSDEPGLEEPPAPPPNQVKVDALRRLRALERRDKTVGTHLDELRALLTILFGLLPD